MADLKDETGILHPVPMSLKTEKKNENHLSCKYSTPTRLTKCCQFDSMRRLLTYLLPVYPLPMQILFMVTNSSLAQ